MREVVMKLLMEHVESAVRTQMRNAQWRETIVRSVKYNHDLEVGIVNLLAHDIAANAVGGLVDTCGLCGKPHEELREFSDTDHDEGIDRAHLERVASCRQDLERCARLFASELQTPGALRSAARQFVAAEQELPCVDDPES